MRTRKKDLSKNKRIEDKIEILIELRDELIKERHIGEAKLKINEIISLCSELASNYLILAASLAKTSVDEAIELYTKAKVALETALDNIEYLPYHKDANRLQAKKNFIKNKIDKLSEINSDFEQESDEESIERPAKRPRIEAEPLPAPAPVTDTQDLYQVIAPMDVNLYSPTMLIPFPSSFGFFSTRIVEGEELKHYPPFSQF